MNAHHQELWDRLQEIQELVETVTRKDRTRIDDWKAVSLFISRRQDEISSMIDLRRDDDVLTVVLMRSPRT